MPKESLIYKKTSIFRMSASKAPIIKLDQHPIVELTLRV
jgi:hypothetical protein